MIYFVLFYAAVVILTRYFVTFTARGTPFTSKDKWILSLVWIW